MVANVGSDIHYKMLTALLNPTVYFGIKDIGAKVGAYLTGSIRDHFALFRCHKDLYGFPDRVPIF
jgi:hypothetical protein